MKVLIISALPFDASSSTRAFKTYFNLFKKSDIAQIYTNPAAPVFSFCKTFYQITDKRMLKSRFYNNFDPGLVFCDTSLGTVEEKECDSSNKVHTFLKRDIGVIHLFRMLLWKEKKWFTPKLINWIESFKPDVVFYHNSNSLFISKIALKIASYFNLPFVVEISDDYYFNKRKLPLIFSSIYRRKYKDFFSHMVKMADGCFFVSDKMKKRYSSLCNQNSDVVHIASECIKNKANFSYNPNTFCYFGNTGLNRGLTLRKLGKKIISINNDFTIDVFSPLQGNQGLNKHKKYPGLRQCGFLKYEDLLDSIFTYEYIILAEPLDKKTADYISLSLSTKVGDLLAFEKKIISIGNISCGTIEYISKRMCSLLLTTDKDIERLSLNTITNYNWVETLENCKRAFEEDFSMISNSKKSLSIIKTAVERHGKNNEKY